MNAENLKPIRSVSEAREQGKHRGVASGVSRRRAKTMKTLLKQIGRATTPFKEVEKMLDAMGVDTSSEAAMALAMITQATRGNVRAYDSYMKYTGQDKLREATIKQMEGETAGGGSGGDVAKLIAALNEGAAADWSGYENELENKEKEGST